MREYPSKKDIINMQKVLNGEDIKGTHDYNSYKEKYWENFDKKTEILKIIKEDFKPQKTFSRCMGSTSRGLAKRFEILYDCKIHDDIIKKAMILCGYNAKTDGFWRYNVDFSSVADMVKKYKLMEKYNLIRRRQ